MTIALITQPHCGGCIEVEKFLEDNDLSSKIVIASRDEMNTPLNQIAELNTTLDLSVSNVPTVVVIQDDKLLYSLEEDESDVMKDVNFWNMLFQKFS